MLTEISSAHVFTLQDERKLTSSCVFSDSLNAQPPGNCGPVLILLGAAGRGTLVVTWVLETVGDVGLAGTPFCAAKPVKLWGGESWVRIGGDWAGEAMEDVRESRLIGEELREGDEKMAGGPAVTLRPALGRLEELCRAIPTPLGAGASISRPSRPLLVASPDVRASTASSRTAGTV